jgi:hypothetical protein
VGLWKRLSRRRAEPPEEAASRGDDPTQLDPHETYRRRRAQIPERFATVPEGYAVEHLSWEEYMASGFDDEAPDLTEVMTPKDLEKVWIDVLRDPDGNIVAERDQEGGRWWTPEEKEADDQAWAEYENRL